MISVEVYDVKYIILLMAGAYLLGNISPAYLLAKKQKNVDIRDVGSGNAGTTNALRFMGKKAALFVFLVDFFKGILASYIGYRLWYFCYHRSCFSCVLEIQGRKGSCHLHRSNDCFGADYGIDIGSSRSFVHCKISICQPRCHCRNYDVSRTDGVSR